MVFKSNIPQAGDLVSDSQCDLLANNLQLDTTYGTDHVKYSDLTAENGKHKTTTFLVSDPEPVTAANVVTSYSFKITDPIGELQYSKGPDDALRTPVTSFHGGPITITTPGTVVLDLTGVARAIISCYAFSDTANVTVSESDVTTLWWNGTIQKYFPIGSTGIFFQATPGDANKVELVKTSGVGVDDVYFVLDFKRLSL